jgi:threonine dehydrogenase-like Zn-dependent dehydrogenase
MPFDIADRIQERAKLVQNASGGLARPVTDAGRRAYDVVLDVSGSLSGLEAACRAVRAGGRLCTMSHLDGYGSTSFVLDELTRQDVEFKSSYLNGEHTSLVTAAQMLACRWDDRWEATIQRMPLRDVQTAFETDRLRTTCKTIVDIGRSGASDPTPETIFES